MELNRNPTKSWAKILDLLSALIKKNNNFFEYDQIYEKSQKSIT